MNFFQRLFAPRMLAQQAAAPATYPTAQAIPAQNVVQAQPIMDPPWHSVQGAYTPNEVLARVLAIPSVDLYHDCAVLDRRWLTNQITLASGFSPAVKNAALTRINEAYGQVAEGQAAHRSQSSAYPAAGAVQLRGFGQYGDASDGGGTGSNWLLLAGLAGAGLLLFGGRK